MSESSATALKFTAPPVRAVTLTVEFEPLASIQLSHIVELIAKWKQRYPSVSERAPRPLSEKSELLSVAAAWPFPTLVLSTDEGDDVIALQSTEIARTWHFDEQGSEYPGYDALREGLRSLLEEFSEAVACEGEEVHISGAEAFYTNILATTTPEQFAHDLVAGKKGSARSLGAQHFGVRAHFCDEEWLRGCALNIFAEKVHESQTSFSLVASTSASSPTEDLGGLDRAHETIIAGFKKFSDTRLWDDWGVVR